MTGLAFCSLVLSIQLLLKSRFQITGFSIKESRPPLCILCLLFPASPGSQSWQTFFPSTSLEKKKGGGTLASKINQVHSNLITLKNVKPDQAEQLCSQLSGRLPEASRKLVLVLAFRSMEIHDLLGGFTKSHRKLFPN